MPEGPLGFPRLTDLGPFVEEDKRTKITEQINPTSRVFFKSSEDMSEINDREVHLIVTSPPYNIGWDYGSFEDDIEFREYKSLLSNVFAESFRVLEQQGRMCINVPTLKRSGSDGGMSHLSMVINMLEQQQQDWRIREIIIWNKKAGRPPEYGTFPQPWGVLLNNIHESIIVAQKPGRRRTRDRPSEEIKDLSVIKDPPGDLTKDVWDIPIPPDSGFIRTDESQQEQTPTFPREIPKRLISLYSFVTDTVLDPFAGTGRTIGEAVRSGRNGVGYEVRSELSNIIDEEVPGEVQMDFSGAWR